MIKYIIGILVSFVFTCMFAFNIVLNIIYHNYPFAFLSLMVAIISFAQLANVIIEMRRFIKEKKK